MVIITLNFLVLHFGEYFMKIQTKIAKLQMHENLHKNVVFFFVALRHMSTAMVMAGRSVHLTTLFPGQA